MTTPMKPESDHRPEPTDKFLADQPVTSTVVPHPGSGGTMLAKMRATFKASNPWSQSSSVVLLAGWALIGLYAGHRVLVWLDIVQGPLILSPEFEFWLSIMIVALPTLWPLGLILNAVGWLWPGSPQKRDGRLTWINWGLAVGGILATAGMFLSLHASIGID